MRSGWESNVKTQTPKTETRPKPPKLVGVYVRPREEHWAELLESVESTDAAQNNGRFAPAEVKLPKSRIMPVYETSEGQRVTLEPTSGGFVTKPFAGGPLLESVVSGGMAGGFMSTSKAPPLPLTGGMSPAAWAEGYMARVPEHTDLGSLQSDWGESSQACAKAVADRTPSSQDEWGQKYFARVRETAASRDQIYQTPDTASNGPQFYAQDPAWKQEEYHGSLFAQFGQAAEDNRKSMAEAQTAAPKGVFAHTPQSRMLAMAGAFQKGGADYGLTVLPLLSPETADRVGQALQQDLEHKLATLQGNGGGTLGNLPKAIRAIQAMGSDNPRAGLAALWQRESGRNDGRPTIFSPGMDQLKSALIQSMSNSKGGGGSGLSQLTSLLGGAAGVLPGLANAFMPAGPGGLQADNAGMVIKDESAAFGGGKNPLGDVLDPGKLLDFGLDQLLGGVNDKSSMGKQLLAKYKDQIKDLLKKAMSPGGLEDLQKQWDSTWKSMPSKAAVKVGLAIGFCGPDLVMVNGLPVTRVGDECIYPPPEPPGKFFQGNPTISVNGMWPSGHIHAAINPKGTIATPMQISPNVLMGEATVSVDVKVEVEAPEGGTSKRFSDTLHASGNSSSPADKRSPTERGLPQVATGLGPDGTPIAAYLDPALTDANGQYVVPPTGAPYILIGPSAEVPAGSQDAILGPDGRYYNPCVLEHELGHMADDYRDNKTYDGSPPTDDEHNATARGARCAGEKGYEGYKRDQIMKHKLPRWLWKLFTTNGSNQTGHTSSTPGSGQSSGHR